MLSETLESSLQISPPLLAEGTTTKEAYTYMGETTKICKYFYLICFRIKKPQTMRP